MKTSLVLLMLQAVFAAVLMWSCFCRLVKTDMNTHREVRWAILFEGTAAGIVFGAPFMPMLMPREVHWQPWTTPSWAWFALLLAVTVMQVVTAKFWAGGTVPSAFQRGAVGRMAGAFAAVGLMFVSLCAVQPVAAQDNPEVYPFHKIAAGEQATCLADEGCVAMTQEVFAGIVRQAMLRGAESCRNTL